MEPTFLNFTVTGSWANCPDVGCRMMHVLNTTGVNLEIRRVGKTEANQVLVLPTGMAWKIEHLTNANQLQMKGGGTVYAEVEP
jgi:2,3-bisphosphoglycerate-independent phosphoglycerate mutase